MNTLTDCGTPTLSRLCREHNVWLCATCIKDIDACDWGGCHNDAAVRVNCRATSSRSVLEVRPLCEEHAAVYVEHVDGGRYVYEVLRLWQTGYSLA